MIPWLTESTRKLNWYEKEEFLEIPVSRSTSMIEGFGFACVPVIFAVLSVIPAKSGLVMNIEA